MKALTEVRPPVAGSASPPFSGDLTSAALATGRAIRHELRCIGLLFLGAFLGFTYNAWAADPAPVGAPSGAEVGELVGVLNALVSLVHVGGWPGAMAVLLFLGGRGSLTPRLGLSVTVELSDEDRARLDRVRPKAAADRPH